MNKYIEYIINNILNEAKVQRTIDKKLWLTVSSTISRNKSSEAEFIKPIGTDKYNLLQRYVAALLIAKKECPQSVDDIEKLKTYKLVGQKYLELGGTIQDIVNLYNLNKFGNTDNTNNTDNTDNQIVNNDQQEDKPQNNLQSSSSSDLFSDFYDDEDNYNIYGEEMLNNLLKLDKDAKLDTVIMELLHITKPAGYKLIKPENDYQRYERVSTSTYNPIMYDAYITKFFKILLANNWESIFDNFDNRINYIINETYRYIKTVGTFYKFKNIIDFKNKIDKHLRIRYKEETLNKFLEYLNSYIEQYNKLDDYYKQLIQDNNFLLTTIYTSPDKGLIFYTGYFKNELSNNFQYFIISKSIITFTGTNLYEDIFDEKNKKSQKVQKQLIKQKNKLQKLYIEFIRNYGKLRLKPKNWVFKLDENNNPYLEELRTSSWVQYTLTSWTPIYFKRLTENIYEDSEIELINRSSVSSVILVRMIKLEKPINNNEYKVIIELTELGEKYFKKYYNE